MSSQEPAYRSTTPIYLSCSLKRCGRGCRLLLSCCGDVLGWLGWLGWLGRWADCVETLQTQFVVEQRRAMGRPLLDVDYACHNCLTDAHRTCDKFVSLCADA